MNNQKILEHFPQIKSINLYQEGNTSHFDTLTSSGLKKESGYVLKKFRNMELCEDAFDLELKKYLVSMIDPVKEYHLEWRMFPKIQSFSFIENQENNHLYISGEFKDCWIKTARLALIEIK